MSKIEELLANKLDVIDYDALLQKYPWINERNRKCVLSPDSDGLLCGLFMAYARGWQIVGFYDDKVGLINNKYRTDDLVFLDGEIFRPKVFLSEDKEYSYFVEKSFLGKIAVKTTDIFDFAFLLLSFASLALNPISQNFVYLTFCFSFSEASTNNSKLFILS